MGLLSRWFRAVPGQAKSRDLEPIDLSNFRYDFHSHLVPGVDDGAPDLDSAIEMIDGLVSLGYEGAVTTPHVMVGTYPNDRSTLTPPFEMLQAAVSERHPNFKLALGAEYFLDASILSDLRNGADLLAPGGRLLFELAFGAPPEEGLLKEFVFEAQVRGFQPVLAHIERYSYWHGELHRLKKLAELGVWFQVNAASLAGAYGREIQQVAETCIDSGWVHLLGTDAHGIRHIDALAVSRVKAAVHRLAKTARNSKLF